MRVDYYETGAIARSSCPHGDPYCPCQDGDACHYEGERPSRCPRSGEKPCTACTKPGTGRPPGGAPRPYPLQPLLDAAGITQGQLGHAVKANGTDVTEAAAHGLTLSQADRWARRLELHPGEIWPTYWTLEETA